ncbi:hypothetical protein MKW94_008436, partial [Papaver nudicaule]|nr:hypothetical protein [Papaver nudicaule]
DAKPAAAKPAANKESSSDRESAKPVAQERGDRGAFTTQIGRYQKPQGGTGGTIMIQGFDTSSGIREV